LGSKLFDLVMVNFTFGSAQGSTTSSSTMAFTLAMPDLTLSVMIALSNSARAAIM
jgi:hypothetical protein